MAENFSGSIFGLNLPSSYASSFPKVSVASVQLPEHFKPFNASLIPLWGSLGLELWSSSQFFFPPQNSPNRVFSNRTRFRVYRPSANSKKPAKKLDWMRSAFFRIYCGFCWNFSATKAQIWIFLKNFKCKGMFLSFSIDYMLFCGSRDVFTGFLAHFFQELWMIKCLPSGWRGWFQNCFWLSLIENADWCSIPLSVFFQQVVNTPAIIQLTRFRGKVQITYDYHPPKRSYLHLDLKQWKTELNVKPTTKQNMLFN